MKLIKNRKQPEKIKIERTPPGFPSWSHYWDKGNVEIVLKEEVETEETNDKGEEALVEKEKEQILDDFWQGKIDEKRDGNGVVEERKLDEITKSNKKHLENAKWKLRATKSVVRGGGDDKKCVIS